MFDKILNEFSSPFYLYNEETIIAKTKILKELNLDFSHKFHFAVKANPNLAILNLLKRQGFGAEVVSAGEFFKSLKAGIDPSEIILNEDISPVFLTWVPPHSSYESLNFIVLTLSSYFSVNRPIAPFFIAIW